MKQEIPAKTLAFLLTGEAKAHGGKFTVQSRATLTDYTFQVDRAEWQGRWYTHVKVETQYLDFRYLGIYKAGFIQRKGNIITTPAASAISWIFREIEAGRFDRVDDTISIMHLGGCLKCGRTLTDADSIDAGIGPHCRGLLKEAHAMA